MSRAPRPPRPAVPLRLEVGAANDTNFAAVMRQTAKHRPFLEYATGVVVPAVLDQLVHGANVMGVRDSRLVAYAGWLRAPRAAAEAWIRGGPLPSPDWTAGDAAIITVFLADDPGDLPALIRGISHVCAGMPVFRMRVFNDSRPEKRRVPIQGRRQFPVAP